MSSRTVTIHVQSKSFTFYDETHKKLHHSMKMKIIMTTKMELHPTNESVQKCQHTGACNCEKKQQNSHSENPALEIEDMHMLANNAVREL